jgi:hypothetical protein
MLFDMDRVSWLSKEHIKSEAALLLDNYSFFRGMEVEPPIPLEHIIEAYLGFTLEYEDLEELIGYSDVLGATWLRQKRIAINEKLLRENIGRMFFTCGHEIGHIVLHSRYIAGHEEKPVKRTGEQEIVCREVASKKRGEWQADYFAACLLMPEENVRRAFTTIFGKSPLIIHNQKSCFGRSLPLFDPAWDRVNEFAQMVIDNGNFSNVSKEAMRVRLEELGLLINNTQNRLLM